MNVIVTLKQLRNDPREYVRLLKSGYEVDITEHRKTMVRAVQSSGDKSEPVGDVRNILNVIASLPTMRLVDENLDTVQAVKAAKRTHLQKKFL